MSNPSSNPGPHRPLSVLILGGSAVMISGLMILIQIVGLLTQDAAGMFGTDISTLAGIAPAAIKGLLDLREYSRYWSWYSVAYFGFVLAAALQFLRLRPWGRAALEAAGWIGLLNGIAETYLSYRMWESLNVTLTALLRGAGGAHYSFLSPLGQVTIFLGLILWLIPCLLMIFFLRKPALRNLFQSKTNAP